MITTTKEPLEIVQVTTDRGPASVLRFVPRSSYADSFGYEWKTYNRTYSDASLGARVSSSRIEHLLGFPLELLSGMTVLEVGSGAGRFTEHLVPYAKQVIASDLSEAVYINGALGAPNLLALQADIYAMPSFSEPVDLVICRGVVQHTPDPRKTIRTLFDLVRPGGLVVFDVYRRTGVEWRNFKYFWRPIIQRRWSVEEFDAFINKHGETLYRWHHRLHRFWNSFKPLRYVIARTPLYWHMNWEHQYPQMTHAQRLAVFKNELVDMFYAHYDQPLTAGEVLEVLGSIGQKPYSYDIERNIFRCRNESAGRPLTLSFTKNGIVTR